MKYPKITALVPQGEEFKEEALNEGIWLTAAHVGAIESSLSASETAATTAAGALATANTARETAEASLNTANETIASQKTEIENLKAEVVKLKKGPAAEITPTVANVDNPAVDTANQNDPKAKYRTSFDEQAEKYAGVKK